LKIALLDEKRASGIPTRGGIILVVDDEMGPRESLRILLKNDYEVYTADSVELGLQLLEECSPDIIFMDIRMPEVDGLEGLRKIRSGDADIPVIMLTGFGDLDTAQAAMRLGATDYLTKPFEISTITDVIAEHLERSKTIRRQRQLISELEAVNEQLLFKLHGKESEGEEHVRQLIQSLNKPMTQVESYTEVLTATLKNHPELMEQSDGSVKEYLGILDDSLKECRTLISRAEETHSSVRHLSVVGPADLLSDLVHICQPWANAQRVDLSFACDPSLPSLLVNRGELLGALHLILRFFIERVTGAQRGRIRLVCRGGFELLEISLIENGEAFQEEHFLQLVDLPTHNGQTVKQIIESHGGSMLMQHMQDEGNRMQLNLPIA
jgi:DNA-binding response OmpR family regulator